MPEFDPSWREAFREQGFFALRGLFRPEELKPVLALMDSIVAREMRKSKEPKSEPSHSWVSDAFAFCANIHREDPVLARFCSEPRLVRIAQRLLGRDLRLHWDQAVYKHPITGQVFPWHQDSAYSKPEPLEYVTCWVAMDSSDTENGTVWILPGSQKKGLWPHEDDGQGHLVGYRGPEKGVSVNLEPGDALIFSSLALHMTGTNPTPRKRRAYVIQYGDADTSYPTALARENHKDAPLVYSGGSYLSLA